MGIGKDRKKNWQLRLFEKEKPDSNLPSNYHPKHAAHLKTKRIVLAKGSLSSSERLEFVEGLLDLYPDAEIIECGQTPHNKIDLGEHDPIRRHFAGKRTLVFGELKDAVRFSTESGNTCPNYWHFSPYGFCPYGCTYCYLAGTRGVWFSPAVKIFLNLPEIIHKIDAIARRIGKPTAFYLGKLQDGLSLDPLTAYSTKLTPFFAGHDYARQIVLTKSADVERLLGLDHQKKTILSWSLNPPEVADRFERDVPSVDERLQAMKRCAAAGYPVRAVLMPVIPVEGWKSIYGRFVCRLIAEASLERLTIGGICSYQNSRHTMEVKLGRSNDISKHFQKDRPAKDGRLRYPPELRIQLYQFIIKCARQASSEIELALCLEEREVWDAVGLTDRLGKCNCVL